MDKIEFDKSVRSADYGHVGYEHRKFVFCVYSKFFLLALVNDNGLTTAVKTFKLKFFKNIRYYIIFFNMYVNIYFTKSIDTTCFT